MMDAGASDCSRVSAETTVRLVQRIYRQSERVIPAPTNGMSTLQALDIDLKKTR